MQMIVINYAVISLNSVKSLISVEITCLEFQVLADTVIIGSLEVKRPELGYDNG
jgi:hypothetical protein